MNLIEYIGQTVSPSKVVCIGRNYLEHINELNNAVPAEPVIFLKPNSAISSQLTSHNETIHYEAEICFLIKNNTISGVGFGLDLTKRQLQSELKAQGLPWERAKAFDGAAVFSHFVQCPANLTDLSMKLYINDQLVQHGLVTHMMFQPEQFMNDISSFMTLEDGDIIMSGTPKGVGVVIKGDKFHGIVLCNEKPILESYWTAK